MLTARLQRMTVITDILATIKRLIFGAKTRHYVDGREVPNFREGNIMAKPKEKTPSPRGKTPPPMPFGKGKGKGPRGPNY